MTITNAAKTSTKAAMGSRTLSSAVKIGTVSTMPSRPKVTMIGLRPTRSESAPETGWRHMKRNSASVITWLAVWRSKPEVLTRNFCM